MKLGIQIQWDEKTLRIPLERIRYVESLGYDSVWSAEAYGSDAITPLAFIAAHTTRIRLGSAIAQVDARTPASTAMSFATLDALAPGRAICGLGLSGPQIVEGWYGRPWGSPVNKLRDTVEIIRKIWKREGPVRHDGKQIQLPYAGPDSSGMGKPLKSILHANPNIPIWLGTGGDANVKLTAELADGWLPFGFRPGALARFRPLLEEGFARAGGGKSLADFEIQAGCSVEITNDVKGAIARQKPFIALYVGGMGHEKMNFHKQRMEREGWPEAAARIQELFLAGKRQEAIDAVPDDYVDEGGLIGPIDRIKQLYRDRWEGCGATGLNVRTSHDEALALMAELAGTRDRE